jgi:hypothetical protein
MTLAEFQIRKRLPGGKGTVLLYDAACLLGWTTVAAIAELVGMHPARAKVELGELVRQGWLQRERQGKGPGSRVRFEARVKGIVGDPLSVGKGIVGDPLSGIVGDPLSPPDTTNTRVPALSSQDCKHLPSGGVQGNAARPDSDSDVRESDVEWLKRTWAWSNVTGFIARAKLNQLKAFGFSRLEMRKYLGQNYQNLRGVEYPLGVVCHETRALEWLAEHRKPSTGSSPMNRPRKAVVSNAEALERLEKLLSGG